MKKIIQVVGILICLSAGGWAQRTSGISEGALLGRVVGEIAAQQMQITRDATDFRILYFRGEKYQMYLGNPSLANYFSASRNGIVISKSDNTIIEQVLLRGLNFFEQEGYTIKSEDGRNPQDILYSVYKKTQKGMVYKVVRLFPIGNNTVLQVVVDTTITQEDFLPVMRRIMSGVRSTPQEVLNAGFPKTYCQFGEDCYQ